MEERICFGLRFQEDRTDHSGEGMATVRESSAAQPKRWWNMVSSAHRNTHTHTQEHTDTHHTYKGQGSGERTGSRQGYHQPSRPMPSGMFPTAKLSPNGSVTSSIAQQTGDQVFKYTILQWIFLMQTTTASIEIRSSQHSFQRDLRRAGSSLVCFELLSRYVIEREHSEEHFLIISVRQTSKAFFFFKNRLLEHSCQSDSGKDLIAGMCQLG